METTDRGTLTESLPVTGRESGRGEPGVEARPAFNDIMNIAYFTSALRGRERLGILFWVYFVAAALLLALAMGLGRHWDLSLVWKPWSLLAIATLVGFYAIWVLIALWQCAFNSGWRGWGYLVRALVLAATAVLVADIVRLLGHI